MDMLNMCLRVCIDVDMYMHCVFFFYSYDMNRHICSRTTCFSRMFSDGDQRSVPAVCFSDLVGGAAWQGAMGVHMDERTRALCYFYKHPPPGSDVKPLKYAEIAAIVRKPGQHRLKQTTIR